MTSPFQSAPFEVVDYILSLTNPETVSRVSQTSRALHVYIRDNDFLWKSLLEKYFDLPPEYSSVDWRSQVQSRIQAKHVVLAFFSAQVSDKEIKNSFEVLIRIARSATPGLERSKNTTWLNGILVNRALWPSHSPLTSLHPNLKRCSQSQSELQVLECDKVGRPGDRLEARAFVYDMRNYRRTSLFGPFMPRGSQKESLRINYVHLRYLMNVLLNNLRDSHSDETQMWMKRGFESGRPMTAPPSLVDGDWAGVQGDWLRLVSWTGYSELEEYNWPDGGLPDATDELDSRIFRTSWFVEGHALLELSMRVTSIDLPSRRHPGKKPTIHFEGNTIGGGSNETGVRGSVKDEGEDVIRWSLTSVMDGGARWHTEGVQIGGVQSAAGWVGCWTSPAHGTYDPAGPSWTYKLR